MTTERTQDLGTLGCEIQLRRLNLELSLRALAEAVGINPSSQTRIEADTLIPRNPVVVKKLEEILGFRMGYLERKIEKRRKEKRSLYRDYPNILALLKMLLIVMSNDEISMTLMRIEQRIKEYSEDRRLLAKNLSDFIMGRTTLDRIPDSGLRPLVHYIAESNDAICNWDGNCSRTVSYRLPSAKPTGLNTK